MSKSRWSDPSPWTELRATRANPPGKARNDPERRNEYIAALEQSQDYFRGAQAQGYASRPTSLFYGLSQAGRALAAAATKGRGGPWKLQGHGLKHPDQDVDLPQIRVLPWGRGDASFIRISELLGSPPLPSADSAEQVTLADLWDSLPETQEFPLAPGRDRRPALDAMPSWHEASALVTVTICGFPTWLSTSSDPARALDRFMAAYPHAAGYSYVKDPRDVALAAPDFSPVHDGKLRLRMHWQTPYAGGALTFEDYTAKATQLLTRYNDDVFLTRAVGGLPRPLHPLMSWWALLFSLSMLARYQPVTWRRYLNVDASTHAVPLEQLLDQALEAVPALLHSTLEELTG